MCAFGCKGHLVAWFYRIENKTILNFKAIDLPQPIGAAPRVLTLRLELGSQTTAQKEPANSGRKLQTEATQSEASYC